MMAPIRTVGGWLAGMAAVALAGMLATGCARVNAVWDAATGPMSSAKTEKAIYTAPVAQGDEASSDYAPMPDFKGSPVPAYQPNQPGQAFQPALEPAKIPVINVFGELDGREFKTLPEGGDYGFQQHTFTDEGYDSDIAIDPTGKLMVFASTRHAEKTDIYLQRVDGTSVTQLTNDPADDAQPVFSPDGRTIAFASTRAGSWDLYTMDLDGRSVTQVTSGPSQDMHPSFSPDGKFLAYCSIGGKSGQWELWIVNLVTREKQMIGYGLFPTWCPDRGVNRIAFQRARQRGSRWFSLWTLDLVEGEARKITEVAVSSNAAIVSPSWSPDGKRLAFSTIVEPAQMSKGKPRGQQDVWMVDADGGNRHRLSDGTGINLAPCWASDGRVYFISDRGGHENIWSARTEPAANWPMAAKKGKERSPNASTGGDLRTTVGSGDPSELAK